MSEILRVNDQNEDLAVKLYKIASALIFTLPGVPSIFYGDEYGMRDNDDSSRACFDWQNYKNEVYEWFVKLTKIRKFSALRDGELNILYSIKENSNQFFLSTSIYAICFKISVSLLKTFNADTALSV